MRYAWLLIAMCTAGLARADMGSTLDEWADRFAPEGGPGPKLPEYADGFDRTAADIAAGRFRAALSDTIALPAGDIRVGTLRARALIGLGESKDALSLLASPPLKSDRDALNVRVETLLEQQNYTDALPIIDGLLAATPDSWSAHRQRGEALELAGRFKDAIDAYHWFLDPQQDLLHKWQTDETRL